MNIQEYLAGLIDDRLCGDAMRFDELWELVPGLAATLRGFHNGWLHWRVESYDGYYCVPLANGRFQVYYQERGSKGPGDMYLDERAAIRAALTVSGIVPGLRPPEKLDARTWVRRNPHVRRLFFGACFCLGMAWSAWKGGMFA